MAFKSILDREFKYRNAVSTDIRLTFDRIRAEQGNVERRVPGAAEAKIVGRIVPRGRDLPPVMNLIRKI